MLQLPLLPGEDPAALQTLTDEYYASWSPTNPVERVGHHDEIREDAGVIQPPSFVTMENRTYPHFRNRRYHESVG
jgi:hypothetical protein